jgi:serine/threonine-protein kinase HipA
LIDSCLSGDVDLDKMAHDSLLILEDKAEKVFDYLLEAGGSPHGARPKAMIGLSLDQMTVIHGQTDLADDYEHWLVKFPAEKDDQEIGLVEHAYANMARSAGVHMDKTLVLPSSSGPGFFATKRFDRSGNQRIHMHTLCGLLHADHRLPSVGYEELIKVTHALTRKQEDVEQVFTRMVFNVLAHNQDDHTKNHSFLMDEQGEWFLSPAYDVVFSDGPGGEHSLDIGGEGKRPPLSTSIRLVKL